MFYIRPWLLALALLSGLSACDSGDDRQTAQRFVDNAYGGGTPPPGASGPATIEFPPPVSRTQDPNVVARGRLDAGVSATLGGLPLTVDSDGRWQVELPLANGANSFDLVYSVDGASTTVATALQVTRAPDDLVSLTDLVVDLERERLVILDSALNRLVAVDFETQTPVNLISDDTTLSSAYFLTVDAVSDQLIVLQSDVEAPLLAVDMSTGAATAVTAPDFANDFDRLVGQPRFVVADEGGYIVLTTESLLIDLNTRNRLSLADFVGDEVDEENLPERPANSTSVVHPLIYRFDSSGEVEFIYEYENRDPKINFGQLYGFAATPGEPTIYLSDAISIKTIDRASGDVSELLNRERHNAELSDKELSDDRSLYLYQAPRNLNLQPDEGRLLALDGGRIVAIELDGGAAKVLASDRLHDSPLKLASAQAMRAEGNRAWVLDDAQDRVVEFDLDSGARSLAFGRDDGGTPLLNPADVALNPATQLAYVTDNARGTLVEIDLNDGSSRILAQQTGTDQVDMGAPLALEISGDGSRVLLINNRAQLIGVDTSTGEKELLLAFDPDRNRNQASRYQLLDIAVDAAAGSIYISDIDSRRGGEIRRLPPVGEASELVSGPTFPNRVLPFSSPTALALDADNERLLVVDSGLNALVEVDIATGARSILSVSAETSDGEPMIALPQDLAIDRRGGRALILDSSKQGLVAVDLEDGSMKIVGGLEIETRDRIYTPRGLTVHPTFEYALIADNTTDKIWALDLVTGERVSIGR